MEKEKKSGKKRKLDEEEAEKAEPEKKKQKTDSQSSTQESEEEFSFRMKNVRKSIKKDIKKEARLFEYQNFKDYPVRQFSISERRLILSKLKEKYDEDLKTTYLLREDLRRADEWRTEMEDELREICANVSMNIVRPGKTEGFNLKDENARWKHTKKILKEVKDFLLKHERTSFTHELDDEARRRKAFSKMQLLKKRKEVRMKREEDRRGERDRIYEHLDDSSVEEQIIFFLDVHGPIEGKNQFSEWMEGKKLVEGTGMLKEAGEDVDVTGFIGNDEEDDELLNTKLL